MEQKTQSLTTLPLPHAAQKDVFRNFHSGTSAHGLLKDHYLGDMDETSKAAPGRVEDPKAAFEAEYRSLVDKVRTERLHEARYVMAQRTLHSSPS